MCPVSGHTQEKQAAHEVGRRSSHENILASAFQESTEYSISSHIISYHTTSFHITISRKLFTNNGFAPVYCRTAASTRQAVAASNGHLALHAILARCPALKNVWIATCPRAFRCSEQARQTCPRSGLLFKAHVRRLQSGTSSWRPFMKRPEVSCSLSFGKAETSFTRLDPETGKDAGCTCTGVYLS